MKVTFYAHNRERGMKVANLIGGRNRNYREKSAAGLIYLVTMYGTVAI